MSETMSEAREKLQSVHAEISRVVVGQEAISWGLMTALVVRGHVLLEGVPGVAKTLLVKTLARTLDLEFRRIQFTPDLMPSDVTGNMLYEASTGDFRFRQGPVFTNLLLADELNRTPPKTQAALLEAMEERQISVEGNPLPLPEPFLVVATQNPIEYEGTYPLPEAQLDRFCFKLEMGYPEAADERRILQLHDSGKDPHDLESLGVHPVATASDIAEASAGAKSVTVTQELMDYLIALAAETRRSPSLALGVSPRGVAQLLNAVKAWAWLSRRDFATPDDVKSLIRPAWRHRLILRPEIELEGGTSDTILEGIIERVPVPD